MKKIIPQLLFIALFFNPVCPVSARIGETKEEIIERYGDPVAKRDGLTPRQVRYSFIKNNFRILVSFLDEHSHLELYTKLDGGDITKQEMQLFLQANGAGQSWEEFELRGTFVFEQKDGMTALAKGKQMFIRTEVHEKYEADAKAAKERKDLDAF